MQPASAQVTAVAIMVAAQGQRFAGPSAAGCDHERSWTSAAMPAGGGVLLMVEHGHHGLVSQALRRCYRRGQQLRGPARGRRDVCGRHGDRDYLTRLDVRGT